MYKVILSCVFILLTTKVYAEQRSASCTITSSFVLDRFGKAIPYLEEALVGQIRSIVYDDEPPHFYWSMFMFRKRRTTNGEQASEAGRYYHKVAAS